MCVCAQTHQVQNTNCNDATQYNGGRPATLLSLSPLLVACYLRCRMAAAAAALLTRCCDADGETSENYWVLGAYEGLGNLPTYSSLHPLRVTS